jgi:hypothetical protein
MNNIESVLPANKAWFTLHEACALKGLNYRTACSKTWLQPNGGQGEKVGGRKCFRREVIAEWIQLSDSQICCKQTE